MTLYHLISLYFFVMILLVVYWSASIKSLNSSGYTRMVSVLSFVICIYIFGYVMELNANEPDQILFWNRFEYLGIPYVSALWATVGLIYTGCFAKGHRWQVPAIYLIPVVSTVLRLTNDQHHLYFASTAFVDYHGKLLFTRTYGIWMYVQTVHSMLLIVTALGLFLYEFIRHRERAPGKLRLLLLASLVAIAGLVLSYLRPGNFILDYMAVCLPFTCLMVIIAIVRYDFLDVKSLAHSKSFESNMDALLLIGGETRMIDFNQKAKQLFSKAGIELANGAIEPVFKGSPQLLASLQKDEPLIVNLRVAGENRYYEISTHKVSHAVGAQVSIKTIHDVTDAYELNATLRRQALMDDLSGLSNRRAFVQNGEDELIKAYADGKTVHLLMLDLDHFKAINDRYGHQMGDQVIQYVGSILKASFPDAVVIARLGGEEFGVLLPGLADSEALQRAENFVHAVAEHMHEARGRKFHLTVSIGVARLPEGKPDLYALMLLADKALYRAKDGGRNRVTWSDGMITGDTPATDPP